MSRPKFTKEMPFHEEGEIFDLVGFDGTEKRTYKVLRTIGAIAEIIQMNGDKQKRGRPLKVLMVENFVEPEYFEIPF